MLFDFSNVFSVFFSVFSVTLWLACSSSFGSYSSMSCCKRSSIAWFVVVLLALGGGVLGTLQYLGVFTHAKPPTQAPEIGPLFSRDQTPVPPVRFTDITKAA